MSDDVATPDEFEMFFEEAIKPPEAKKEEAAPEGEKAAPEEVSETEEEVVEEKEASPAETEEQKVAKAAEAVKAEETRKAEEAKQVEADKVRKTAEAAKAEEARVAEEARKAEAAKKAEPTEDDQKLLAEVAKDFPEVKKALEVQERLLTARFEQVLEGKLTEMAKKFEPMIATTQVIANNAHEAAILGKHADAREILPETEKWIGEQPSFLRETYNKVLDHGTSAQVIELFDTFKKATGRDKPPEEKTEAQKAAEAEAARLEAEKKKKLDSQEGVRSRRSETKSGVAEDDFEGAFNVAASR